MNAKKITKKAAKPSLKAGSVEKVKTLGIQSNHNETLVRNA